MLIDQTEYVWSILGALIKSATSLDKRPRKLRSNVFTGAARFNPRQEKVRFVVYRRSRISCVREEEGGGSLSSLLSIWIKSTTSLTITLMTYSFAASHDKPTTALPRTWHFGILSTCLENRFFSTRKRFMVALYDTIQLHYAKIRISESE